jgi:hypothetical protein
LIVDLKMSALPPGLGAENVAVLVTMLVEIVPLMAAAVVVSSVLLQVTTQDLTPAMFCKAIVGVLEAETETKPRLASVPLTVQIGLGIRSPRIC